MCGRYRLSNAERNRERFQIESGELDLAPRYNIAPQQVLPVVVRDGGNHLELMQWGLIPFWSKEQKSIAINARVEGILNKPAFRKPIRYHRCLIPATGFYAWKKVATGKTPYHIHRKDGDLFAFAGIFDLWRDQPGNETKTFAIITTAPNEFLAQVHDRLPLILQPEQESLWLTTEPGKIDSLLQSLQPLPAEELEMYPVSRAVNWAGNDSPQLVEKVESADTDTLYG